MAAIDSEQSEQVFENNDEFSNWLEPHQWFEDSYCLSRQFDASKKSLSLIIAYYVEGTYEVNTEMTQRVFSILAEDVSSPFPLESLEIRDQLFIYGIDIKDEDSISFSIESMAPFDLWPELYVKCARVRVQEQSRLTKLVKPHLRKTELSFEVVNCELPSPQDWLNWFADLGHELGWRYYDSELKSVQQVASNSCEGWYLQEPGKISSTKEGLFFFHHRETDAGFSARVRRAELGDSVWESLKRLILNFSEFEVRCGNCKFDREEWMQHLRG